VSASSFSSCELISSVAVVVSMLSSLLSEGTVSDDDEGGGGGLSLSSSVGMMAVR